MSTTAYPQKSGSGSTGPVTEIQDSGGDPKTIGDINNNQIIGSVTDDLVGLDLADGISIIDNVLTVRAGNTSQTGLLRLASAGESSSTKAAAANDPRLSSVGYLSPIFYGSGEDGDVTFDGSTTITGFTLASGIYTYTGTAKVLQYNNMTISDNVSVIPAGCPVRVRSTLTFSGSGSRLGARGGNSSGTGAGQAIAYVTNSFLAAGTNGAAGVAQGTDGAASTAVTAVSIGGRGGTGGHSHYDASNRPGGAGGAITAWTTANGPHFRLLTDYNYRSSATATAQAKGGSGGGSGGASTNVGGVGSSTSGGGGAGGGAVDVAARYIVSNGGSIGVDGGNGGQGTGTVTGFCGGGGGGGAGGIVIYCDSITGTLNVSAAGGIGGPAFRGTSVTAFNPDGGNGGNGGLITVYYGSKETLNTNISGGTGGAGAGTGATGSTGTSGTATLIAL